MMEWSFIASFDKDQKFVDGLLYEFTLNAIVELELGKVIVCAINQ